MRKLTTNAVIALLLASTSAVKLEQQSALTALESSAVEAERHHHDHKGHHKSHKDGRDIEVTVAPENKPIEAK